MAVAIVVQSVPFLRCLSQTQNPITTNYDRQPRRQARLSIPNSKYPQSPTTTRQVLEEIPHSIKTIAWNNLIQTHISNNDVYGVMVIYQQMLLRGVRPDKHTLPRILTASSRLSGSKFYGKQIHGHIFKFGLCSDQYVLTALMTMYATHDGVDVARVLFEQSSNKNAVSWTLLVKLCTKEDKHILAIRTFKQMVDLGVEVDAIALVTILEACAGLNSLQQGKKVHEIARKFGLESDVLVANSLIKMYLECKSLKDSRMVFDQLPSKDVISWTSIICGYVNNGEINEGLKLFRLMNAEGIKPDSFTISGILPACGRIAAQKHGKEIHTYMYRNGVDSSIAVQNSLTNMYVKSGSLESAVKFFVRMKKKDKFSLTIMILGYSLHGRGELGVELFREMENLGSKVDDAMYAALLHACNTSRMVEEGRSYFRCIRAPMLEHFTLMVSLLARAGLFGEAKAFVDTWQIEMHPEVHRALLHGCRIHRDRKMAKRIIELLTEMEPLNAENYVLLSNLYASHAKWDLVEKMGETIGDMGLRPNKAYSWIEVRNKVHVFGVGDVSHPRSEMIYYELQGLMKKMKEEEEFVFDTDFSLHDVDEERECTPIGHSEMLAISFGLISGKGAIYVTKNLRVCRNCHSSAKVISKIVGREIVLKDPNLFHHFKDGFCSCGDFW
ncbi:hypothetical protein GIB67_032972 [Kingdonia uniflora]|uniref:DYW domain-containing protein n=1 Tax=Kingdonia uniflora TaxID=39325 RepID=A0A7J7MYX7_9MAGN|nr:hypothetical protein GIB67_032972 [Kingdonia uniflora]